MVHGLEGLGSAFGGAVTARRLGFGGVGVRVPAGPVPAALLALALPAALVGVDGAYRQLPWRGGIGCLVALVLLAGVARRLPVHAGLVLLAGAAVLDARDWAASREQLAGLQDRLASLGPGANLAALLDDPVWHADSLRRLVISAAGQVAACVCFAAGLVRARRPGRRRTPRLAGRAALLAAAGVVVSALAACSAAATAWDFAHATSAAAPPPGVAGCCDYGGAGPQPIVTIAFVFGTSPHEAWTAALLLLGAALSALASMRADRREEG